MWCGLTIDSTRRHRLSFLFARASLVRELLHEQGAPRWGIEARRCTSAATWSDWIRPTVRRRKPSGHVWPSWPRANGAPSRLAFTRGWGPAPLRAALYAIDPFLGGRLGVCWNELIARREMRRLPVRIEVIRALSHQAASQIEGDFDLLFIDGDHSDDGIRRDWSDWSPRIQPGGIVALHDTRASPHNPGVETLGSFRYFESDIRHDPRFRLVRQVDTLSVLERTA
jgi:hypothetical protein